MADVMPKVYHNPSYNYGRLVSGSLVYIEKTQPKNAAGKVANLPNGLW